MLNFLFNPNGRVSRSQMWLWFILPQMALTIGAGVIDASLFGAVVTKVQSVDPKIAMPTPSLGFGAALGLFYFWPNIAVAAKRFHDRAMSGWWVLWFGLAVAIGVALSLGSLIAAMASEAGAAQASFGASTFIGFAVAGVAGFAQFVILYLLPGHDGANQFGPDPRTGGDVADTSEWADDLDPLEAARRLRAEEKTSAASRRGGPSGGPSGGPPRKRRTPTVPSGRGFGAPARSTFGRRGMA